MNYWTGDHEKSLCWKFFIKCQCWILLSWVFAYCIDEYSRLNMTLSSYKIIAKTTYIYRYKFIFRCLLYYEIFLISFKILKMSVAISPAGSYHMHVCTALDIFFRQIISFLKVWWPLFLSARPFKQFISLKYIN